MIICFIKLGEKGGGFRGGSVDLSEIDVFSMGEELVINRAAADDEDFFGGVFVLGDELVDIVDYLVGAVEVVAGNDDVFAVFEFAWEGIPGFVAHDDFVTLGGILKEFHVFFDVKY